MGNTPHRLILAIWLYFAFSLNALESEGEGYQIRTNVEKSVLLEQKLDLREPSLNSFGRNDALKVAIEGKLENNIDFMGKINQESSTNAPPAIDFSIKKESWSARAGYFSNSSDTLSFNNSFTNRTIDGVLLKYSEPSLGGSIIYSRTMTQKRKEIFWIESGSIVLLSTEHIKKETFLAEMDGQPLIMGRDYIIDAERGCLKFTARYWSTRRIEGMRERGKLRVFYEADGDERPFGIGNFYYRYNELFSISASYLDGNNLNGGHLSFRTGYDSLISLESDIIAEKGKGAAPVKKALSNALTIRPLNGLNIVAEAEASDSSIESSGNKFYGDITNRYKATAYFLAGSFNANGEWERRCENIDSLLVVREEGTAKLSIKSGNRSAISLWGNYERMDNDESIFTHCDAAYNGKNISHSVGIEYYGKRLQQEERIPLFIKSGGKWGELFNGYIRLSSDASLKKYSMQSYMDGRTKIGDLNLSGVIDIDTNLKPLATIDGNMNFVFTENSKITSNARGIFADSAWKTLLCRTDIKFYPSEKLTVDYSPLIHRNRGDSVSSVSFVDISHNGSCNVSFKRIKNSMRLILSDRQVESVRNEWSGEKGLSDALIFSAGRNSTVTTELSINRSKEGERAPLMKQNEKERSCASLSVLGYNTVLGQIEIKTLLSVFMQNTSIDSGADIDTMAFFVPNRDSLRNSYYFTNRVIREGSIIWQKGNGLFDGKLASTLVWDTDRASPIGETIENSETVGIKPEIRCDFYPKELFSISLTGGGEWCKGYRSSERLFSSLEGTITTKYVIFNTSLFWEKEKRSMGKLHTLEWRMEGTLRL